MGCVGLQGGSSIKCTEFQGQIMIETKCYNLFHLHDYRHYREGWVKEANKVNSFLPPLNQMQHFGTFMIHRLT